MLGAVSTMQVAGNDFVASSVPLSLGWGGCSMLVMQTASYLGFTSESDLLIIGCDSARASVGLVV